jgi:hypothetical protein
MADNDKIDIGNGVSLRPLDDPLMGRIHMTVNQVLQLVAKKAGKLPVGCDETTFALNVLTSALAAVTDQLRKSDPELHRRAVTLVINRLTMDVAEIQSLLDADGKAH